MTDDDSSLATYFDRCAAEGVMAAFSAEEEPRIERLVRTWVLAPGRRVLEPGCGSGRLTERLARGVAPGGQVLAFDISPGMIAKARERTLPGHVEFAVADATAIPARDESFDVAVAFHVFPHFSDPAAALAELARVLVQGGRLWVNHLKGSEELNAFHRTLSPAVAGHVLPGRDEMTRLLAEAGFDIALFEDGAPGYAVSAVLARRRTR